MAQIDPAQAPDQNPDEKSCGTVLFRNSDQGRLYLVLHYPSGHFDYPKGHVEEGEEDDEHSTALRELEEETGIADGRIIPGFRSEMYYTYNRKGKTSLKLVVFFVAQSDAEEITISHEHQDFLWLTYEEALEQLTFENAKNLLQKAENFLDHEVGAEGTDDLPTSFQE
jgi:bis(5'-nucleosidyl)-tetraphosphatase